MAIEVGAARQRIIRRPRLTSMLDDSMARIRLLIAPAGYGKTTLAREWLGDSKYRDVWYRGGPASADVAALAAGLSEAASQIVPEAGKRMLDRLRATGHPEEDVEILAELFAEDVQEWPPDAWLAFDDYQFAMDSVASERFVDFLTQQTPVQLLITSRRRPSWATARRILYGEILEIDRRALAMEDAEARAVLGRNDQATEELISRAKGWPAVLGLASLSDELELRDRHLPDALYEYFAEELLQAVGPAVQNGLSQLAALPTLSTRLATRLLGERAETVLNEGIRIGAITRNGPDLEQHPLLRQFLTSRFQELSGSDVRNFADEVVHILLSERRWDEAFHVIVSLKVPHLLPDLISSAINDLLREGRTQTLTQWLEHADATHLGSPVIDLAESEIAFREGHYAKAEALALSAAHALENRGLKAQALIRAAQSAMLDSRDEQALQSFRKARSIANTDHTRLEALVGECFAVLELGLAREAPEVFEHLARQSHRGAEMRLRQAMVQLARAARLGGIGPALQLGAEVRPLLDKVKDPLVATSFLNTYAHLLVLSARYEEALEFSRTQLEVAEKYRVEFVLPHALLINAIAQTGLREFSRASEQVAAAEEHGRHSEDVHIAMYVAAVRARIAVHKQDFDTAIKHAAETWDRPGSDAMRAELAAYRGLATACTGDAAGSKALLSDVRAIPGLGVEATGLTICADAIAALNEGRMVTLEVASGAFRAIETIGAFDCFVTAVRGSPTFLADVVRSLDDSTTVARVLGDSNDFRLARSAGLTLQGPRRGPMRNLSSRELEVARLVARGHTNRTIAGKLYISESTVKVHVRHILDKIGARSRTELAARIATLD